MSTTRALVAQAVVTSIVSSIAFGLAAGNWIAGALAPYLVLVIVVEEFFRPFHPGPQNWGPIDLYGFLLGSAIFLSARNRMPRVAGHLALLLFNVLSVLCAMTGA
jgi:hypothetical protein